MSFLPLGIISAALYIYFSNITINEYLKRMIANTEELIKHEDVLLDRYDDSKGIHSLRVSLSLNINSKSDNAKKFLQFCSFLSSENIPLYILKELFKDPLSLENIIDELISNSLVNVFGSGDDRSITIPQVLQALVRNNIPEQEKNKFINILSESFTKYFVKDTFNSDAYQRVQKLFSHVCALLDYLESSNNKVDKSIIFAIARLNLVRGYTLSQTGRAIQAEKYYKVAKAICDNLCGIKEEISKENVENIYNKLATITFDGKVSPIVPILYAAIHYFYGRQLPYTGENERKAEFRGFLVKSKLLCEMIESKTKDKIFYKILVDRVGLCYFNEDGTGLLYFDNTNDEVKRKLEEDVINKYELLKEDQNSYIDDERNPWNSSTLQEKNYDLKTDNVHKLFCARQLLKAYSLIAILEEDASKLNHYFEKARNYANDIINIYLPQAKSMEGKAHYYNTLGFLFINKKCPYRNLSEAENYFTKAKDEEEKLNGGRGRQEFMLADSYKGLALIHQEKGNKDEASILIEKCLKIRKQIHKEQNHKSITEAEKIKQNIDKMNHQESKLAKVEANKSLPIVGASTAVIAAQRSKDGEKDKPKGI